MVVPIQFIVGVRYARITPQIDDVRADVYTYSKVVTLITLWSNWCMPHSHDKLYWNNRKHTPLTSTLARLVTRGLHAALSTQHSASITKQLHIAVFIIIELIKHRNRCCTLSTRTSPSRPYHFR